jgi:alkylhydroperoxidase/carboxymuconolactone decarboxylase family protein YurZ
MSRSIFRVDGTRIHMTNALKVGATPQDIVEALTLVSTLGTASILEAVPLLKTAT